MPGTERLPGPAWILAIGSRSIFRGSAGMRSWRSRSACCWRPGRCQVPDSLNSSHRRSSLPRVVSPWTTSQLIASTTWYSTRLARRAITLLGRVDAPIAPIITARTIQAATRTAVRAPARRWPGCQGSRRTPDPVQVTMALRYSVPGSVMMLVRLDSDNPISAAVPAATSRASPNPPRGAQTPPGDSTAGRRQRWIPVRGSPRCRSPPRPPAHRSRCWRSRCWRLGAGTLHRHDQRERPASIHHITTSAAAADHCRARPTNWSAVPGTRSSQPTSSRSVTSSLRPAPGTAEIRLYARSPGSGYSGRRGDSLVARVVRHTSLAM